MRRVLVVRSLEPSECAVAATLQPPHDTALELTDWTALSAWCPADNLPDLLIAVVPASETGSASAREWLSHNRRPVPVLAILACGAPDVVVRDIASRVDDFMFRPVSSDEFRARVVRLLRPAQERLRPIHERLTAELGLGQLIGSDPAFSTVIRDLPILADTDAPVLITGETGTGKDLCARAIHHLSARRNQQFIPVDCGAVPEHLFENELFGHARGAFTDARVEQKGLAGLADGGTLFLDEIDALAPGMQAKLLRFLQDRTYKPLGSDRFVRADVRLLAATNRDIEASVSDKSFRSDLYYRLNVLRVHLPPLRRRMGDLPLLAEHFVRLLSASRAAKQISPDALRKLLSYEWPGNVRELHNVIQRAVLYSSGNQINAEDISFPQIPVAARVEPAAGSFRMARARTVASFEREYVEELLRKHDGNITHAAREAGKDRRAFGRLVKKYRIDGPARSA